MSPPPALEAPRWTEEQLEAERIRAIEVFRKERMEEPLEQYLDVFDEYQGRVEELFETTVDLTELGDKALEVLCNPNLIEALRYLSGPPISLDDLKVVSEVGTLAPGKLRAEPALAKRIVDTIRLGLDRRRFPWIAEGREPTEAERNAAVLASAALLGASRAAMNRRSEGNKEQEEQVKAALRAVDFKEVPRRKVTKLADAPKAGEFCGESLFGTRKADLLVGLWDDRTMPLECKVSNSATNSVKRLNNDAAVKAKVWRDDFGNLGVVPSAVLSGVYKLNNLIEAQDRGLTIFWAHDLRSLTDWIARTR